MNIPVEFFNPIAESEPIVIPASSVDQFIELAAQHGFSSPVKHDNPAGGNTKRYLTNRTPPHGWTTIAIGQPWAPITTDTIEVVKAYHDGDCW